MNNESIFTDEEITLLSKGLLMVCIHKESTTNEVNEAENLLLKLHGIKKVHKNEKDIY